MNKHFAHSSIYLATFLFIFMLLVAYADITSSLYGTGILAILLWLIMLFNPLLILVIGLSFIFSIFGISQDKRIGLAGLFLTILSTIIYFKI